MNIKKIFLGVGTLGIITTPIIATISCSCSSMSDQTAVELVGKHFDGINIVAHIEIPAVPVETPLNQSTFNNWLSNGGYLENSTEPFVFPTDLKGTDVKYTLTQLGNELNSKATATIIITKGNAKVTKIIQFSRDHKPQAEVEKAYAEFQSAVLSIENVGKSIAAVTSPKKFNLQVLKDIGGKIIGNYPTNLPNGLILTYTNFAITTRGNLKVFISKDGALEPKSFNIRITI